MGIIKQITVITLGCLMPLATFSMNAPKTSGESCQTAKVQIIQVGKYTSGRPKCPSRQHIECYYGEGKIYIEFDIPEGEATLKIINTENELVVNQYFNSMNPLTYYIGDNSNLTRLEITTNNGNIYEGWLNDVQ